MSFRNNIAMGCGTGFVFPSDLTGWDIQDNHAINCGVGFEVQGAAQPIPEPLIQAVAALMADGAPKDAVAQSFGTTLAKYGFDLSKAISTAADGTALIETLMAWGTTLFTQS